MKPKLSTLLAGAAVAIGARAILPRLLLLQFRPGVKQLNAGEHEALLDNYADDFVLHFHQGPHRWSGDWVGKAGFDRFLQNFVAAGIQGEIKSIAISGPPWAMKLWVRFDDYAEAPDGTRIYENRGVLVLRTRWGKGIEQHDYFADTAAILALENSLQELGVEAIAR